MSAFFSCSCESHTMKPGGRENGRSWLRPVYIPTEVRHFWLVISRKKQPPIDTPLPVIYQAMQVPDMIIEHQLAVATVAEYVATVWQEPSSVAHWLLAKFILGIVNPELVRTAALFHDLANLIKIKEFLPGMKDQEGYWFFMQFLLKEQWGEDEEIATKKMVERLGFSPKVSKLIYSIGYRQMQRRWHAHNVLALWYADMCVSPDGIVGYDARKADVMKRYGYSPDHPEVVKSDKRAHYVQERLPKQGAGVVEIPYPAVKTKLLNLKFSVQLF